ncbi:HD-GYP domain-containing protein [Catenulispora yoronensis]
MLARQLRMPQERVAMLRFAGLLHDIGKLGVPTRLLTSTGGLTEEEFKLLCMHPNHGVAVLRDIRFLTEVYEGVLYHHERLDGRGYPTGKSGDEIPEFARIIGVADAFDAMTSTRSYRAARTVEEAVTELRRGAGTQFDPVLVRAFEEALALAERAGRPWVPTELPAAPPAEAGAVPAIPAGPWPLPKRVPGFSFADHDDPFVPAEWFSDWFPSWLADAWEGTPGGGGPQGPFDWPLDEGVPPPGPGGIPGQRSAELPPGADFDDGWSARMHSAVVRGPGPDPEDYREDRDERRLRGQSEAGRAERGERTERTEPVEERRSIKPVDDPSPGPAAEGAAGPFRMSHGSMRIRGVDDVREAEGEDAGAAGSSWFSRDLAAESSGPMELREPVDAGDAGDFTGAGGAGDAEAAGFEPAPKPA